jgi:hypothetical protein
MKAGCVVCFNLGQMRPVFVGNSFDFFRCGAGAKILYRRVC